MDKWLSMGINGTLLILAVICFRYFFSRQIPRRFFVFLWICAIARLLLPVSIPVWQPSGRSPALHELSEKLQTSAVVLYNNAAPILLPDTGSQAVAPSAGVSDIAAIQGTVFLCSLWLPIAVLLAAHILNRHMHDLRLYRMSLPADEGIVSDWLRRHRTIRQTDIRKSEFVKSPLTYGLIHPVILLPSEIELNPEELLCILEHEWTHIRRWDILVKYLLYLTICIYWFHPLVWMMAPLLNRDIELACDEKVIRQMDLDGKKQYSTALLECNTGRRLVTICPLAFGEVGVKERVKNVLNYKKPAFWLIAVAVVACGVVTACFATNPVTEEPSTPNAERPTLIVDCNVYVNPYMPVSYLPYGYQSAGKLTREQANNTGLEGIEYFVHPSETEDFYTYQECGTPIDLNTVDSEQRQWAYMRWIQVKDDGVEGRKLTLDDVVMLSQKGDALSWSDFERYQGWDVGSGLYIMRYEIDELFDVLVGGVPDETPWYIYLRVNNEADDRIDIRTEDVSTFVEAHRNDVPKVIEPKPDGGGEPAPEEPDFSTLSEEQAAIRQAILEHNRSADLTGVVPCVSFAELASFVVDGSDFAEYIHYGWALYEEYRVTDSGLETVTGSHAPVAITFREDPSGALTLEEYWQPRDGSYYAQDIREKFPAHIVEDGMDSQKFILQQTQECYAQAVAATGLDTDQVIGSLIETICSGPALSSNPGDYIEAHPIEYRELTYYGRYTLKYCFTKFLKGGQTDLRGHIMRAAMDDIAPEAQLKLYAETGQEYFDAWKDAAKSVGKQHDMEWIEENQPAIYLLLQMISE